MEGEKSPSRRKFLRAVAAGSGVAVLGGVGGALLFDNAGTLASKLDLEIFPENYMESGRFELRTAWKLHDANQTIPEGQDTFPEAFASVESARLPFGDMDPGSSGTVYGAYTLRNPDGTNSGTPQGVVEVHGNGRSTSQALLKALTFETQKTTDLNDGFADGTSSELASLSNGPILRFDCAHSGKFKFTYTLPSAGSSVLRDITPEDSLTIELTLTAEQCASIDQ